MASGILIDKACEELYKKFQTGDKAFRAIVFRVKDDLKSVVPDDEQWQIKKDPAVDPKADTANCLKMIKNMLVTGDTVALPRWILMNFEFLTSDGRDTDKSIFVKWCPEGATIRQRMVFTTSTKGLLDGINCKATTVQGDGLDDLDEIIGKLESGVLK